MFEEVIAIVEVVQDVENGTEVATFDMMRETTDDSVKFSFASIPAVTPRSFILNVESTVFNGWFVSSFKLGGVEKIEWPGLPAVLFFSPALSINLDTAHSIEIELKPAEKHL